MSSNVSGTITTGGTAQQISPATPLRKKFTLQNISGEDLWIRYDGQPAADSAPGSFAVAAGQYFVLEASDAPFQAISIVGATTGSAYSAMEVP